MPKLSRMFNHEFFSENQSRNQCYSVKVICTRDFARTIHCSFAKYNSPSHKIVNIFYLHRFPCICAIEFILRLICVPRVCWLLLLLLLFCLKVKIVDWWTFSHLNVCLHIFDRCHCVLSSFLCVFFLSLCFVCSVPDRLAQRQRYTHGSKQIEKHICRCGGVWSFIGLFRARAAVATKYAFNTKIVCFFKKNTHIYLGLARSFVLCRTQLYDFRRGFSLHLSFLQDARSQRTRCTSDFFSINFCFVVVWKKNKSFLFFFFCRGVSQKLWLNKRSIQNTVRSNSCF